MTRDARGQPSGFHLLDASALVVGYGLASMLLRAYWSGSEPPNVVELAVTVVAFTWLGLAMSGPVVLLIRRPVDPPTEDHEAEPGARTWAELAWMIVGFYWIGMTILVVPIRMNGTRFHDSAILGLFPVLAAVYLWIASPAKNRPSGGAAVWTHRAGVLLLLTWPFAWIALIVLGKTLF
jgi:hypothetical protein